MYHMIALVICYVLLKLSKWYFEGKALKRVSRSTPLSKLAEQAGRAVGKQDEEGATPSVKTEDMLLGGSGSSSIMDGRILEIETVKARYIVNCAGGASDQVAELIGDSSFKIKPRVGDYLLLHRNQVIFCPDRWNRVCSRGAGRIFPAVIATSR